jgi:hypothetical protein
MGVRVTYEVTFSENGEYSPHLFVSPVEKGDILIDTNPMNVVKSRITPVPGELQGVKYEYMYKTARSEHRHVAAFFTSQVPSTSSKSSSSRTSSDSKETM